MTTTTRHPALIAQRGLKVERYRHATTGQGATLRYWVTPRGNHAVECGLESRAFRDVTDARLWWAGQRCRLTAAGFERAE